MVITLLRIILVGNKPFDPCHVMIASLCFVDRVDQHEAVLH